MATKPTVGGSDGTWGTELNAFLDVSLASDGKVKDGAVLEAATESTDGDRTIADLAFVVGNGYPDVDGTPTAVFTKYLTGTTDADSATLVAHGITGIDNILSMTVSIFNVGSTRYETADNRAGDGGNAKFISAYDGSNVILTDVGSDFQSQKYRIRIDYVV